MSIYPVSKDPLARLIEKRAWIPEAMELIAQQAIKKPFQRAGSAGDSLLSFLHGEWLHEPLHAILTDVPVGAWTVTVVADAIGAVSESDSMDKVADVSLAIGLVGAAGAAITGMVDWSEVKQPSPRRIGAAHALLNVAATTLIAISCFTRTRKAKRSLSRSLAIAGYVVATLSAHLGGNLVYEHSVGVRTEPS